ncbi:MAG: SRPBCC domain-containing protein [Phenylobacterium sp.]|nr:SRPBCC domain-containing protein [Phenylobacterium sp.]
MPDEVSSIIEIATPRERVWTALTDPTLVTRWMGCLEYAPTAGHVFYLQPDRARRLAGDATDGIACRIEVLDAPRRLSFAWGIPASPETFVDIRLTRIAGGTHVRLVHSGWDRFDAREAAWLQEGLGRAWHDVALPALKAVAEGF